MYGPPDDPFNDKFWYMVILFITFFGMMCILMAIFGFVADQYGCLEGDPFCWVDKL